MNVQRILFSILIICLFSIAFAFAGGSNEARLYYLPRNVVNNNNVMVELTQQQRLTTIDRDYSNTSDGFLAIFRLRSSIYSSDQTVSGGIVVTISSNDNWNFVNENNPTSTRPFELNAFCVERKKTSRSYDTNYSIQELEASTTLSKSGVVSYFKKVGNTYQLLIPYTGFDRDSMSKYANYIREFDICLSIPNTDESLETGYYQTELTFTTTLYQEHYATESIYPVMKKDGSTKSMTENIIIRGYAGLDRIEDSGSYSFSVVSASDTYTMDLGISSQGTPYEVAKAQFSCLDLVDSEPNSNQKNKFTVYISPTSDYTASGQYKFIKMNSENQARTAENTIYYDLYLSTSSGYKTFSSIGSSTFPDGSLGSAGVGSQSTTYKLVPKYDGSKISSSGGFGGSNQWKETWTLDQNIYLKLTTDSLSAKHQSGLYYSYIYFTLVTN